MRILGFNEYICLTEIEFGSNDPKDLAKIREAMIHLTNSLTAAAGVMEEESEDISEMEEYCITLQQDTLFLSLRSLQGLLPLHYD